MAADKNESQSVSSAGPGGGGGHGHHDHDPNLQHHFDTPDQQFNASKLGMWLFLATEILLFSGLFCGYAVYRGNHADIFYWGHHFLDKKMGGLNTIVLITSSLTMAWAVRCSMLGQKRRLVAFLTVTLLCGFTFMVVKYFEYKPKFEHGLLWSGRFDPDPHYVMEHFGQEADEEHGEAEAEHAEVAEVDLENGKTIFLGTCASCHGPNARGLPKQGADLINSTFAREKTEDELVAYVKVGRNPWDPESIMKIPMPPKGGNPTLDDADIRDTVAYLKTVLEATPPDAAVAETEGGGSGEEGPGGETEAAATATEEVFMVHKSVLPPPINGPAGLADVYARPYDENYIMAHFPPANPSTFFSFYFMLTGLHGIHVLAGMIVIFWLLLRALRGHFGPRYFTPVDLGGLYWHLVDLIWIFLFPLLYLI